MSLPSLSSQNLEKLRQGDGEFEASLSILSFSQERKDKKGVFLCQINGEIHVYGFKFKVRNGTFCLVPTYFEFKICRDFQIV